MLVVGLLAWWAGSHIYDQPGPLEADRDFVIPHGSMDQISTMLELEKVVNNATSFRIAALLTRGQGPAKAAELRFPAHATLRTVLEVLRFGKPVQHHLTIPEGLTAAQVVLLFNQADTAVGVVDIPPEGSVLPETYLFERGTDRHVLMQRATQAMSKALNAAWAARAQPTPLASAHDALVLASIVERETSKPEERPRVAAVFLNRLRMGMKLQSDPTVAYGAAGGLGSLNHGITRAELNRTDPYNTYKIAGLPPDPICMPGLASLQAVTTPFVASPGFEELYFVANGSGGHVFARTEEEHARNVERWREIERFRAGAPVSVPAN